MRFVSIAIGSTLKFLNLKPIIQDTWLERGPPSHSLQRNSVSKYEIIRQRHPEKYDFTSEPWRFPLWQVANEPEFFAYKAGNRMGWDLPNRTD